MKDNYKSAPMEELTNSYEEFIKGQELNKNRKKQSYHYLV